MLSLPAIHSPPKVSLKLEKVTKRKITAKSFTQRPTKQPKSGNQLHSVFKVAFGASQDPKRGGIRKKTIRQAENGADLTEPLFSE
jgi:hypothetical protein